MASKRSKFKKMRVSLSKVHKKDLTGPALSESVYIPWDDPARKVDVEVLAQVVAATKGRRSINAFKKYNLVP